MSAIDMVREGMDVVDSAGDKVGKVRTVSLGDPEAVTSQGQELDSGMGLLDNLRAAFGATGDLPDGEAERLLRLGFVQIDRPLFERDVFVSSREVDRVDDDTVYLTVRIE